MSRTTVDMAKVTQMLDAGWAVQIAKNQFGSYSASATHERQDIIDRANKSLREKLLANDFPADMIDELLEPNEIETDDFTPEQALSRLAYKIHGEIVAC